MALTDAETIEYEEADRRGWASVLAHAAHGQSVVVKAADGNVALVSFDVLDDMFEDLYLGVLAVTRSVTDGSPSVPFDSVLAELGITLAELEALPDDD